MPAISAPTPPMPGRLRPVQWRLLDVCTALVYGTLSATLVGSRTTSPFIVVAVAMLAVAALLTTRQRPAVGLLCALALAWLAPADTEIGFLALAPVGYAVAMCASRLPRRFGWLALAASLTAPLATAVPDFEHVGAIVPFGLVLVTCWAVGIAVGAQRRYAESVLRQHKEAAATAVAEERLRIARELHDIVAHSMSVITVQAAFAHLVIQEQPTEAAAALGAIESTGREVLVELRRLLGVLREDGAPDLAPAAGLRELDALVALTSRAGVEVTLHVTGEPPELAGGLELTAYRIVQEALANVVRHAGTARAEVSIEFTDEDLRITVTDEGRGPAGSTVGHGLAGMRERVALYGGEMAAGPREGPGFQVVARIPVRASAVVEAG